MNNEFSKVVADFIIHNVSFSIIVIVVAVSAICKIFFKVTKKEINPLAWIASKIGNAFTKDVKKDISDFKDETNKRMDEIKKDIASINHDHYEKIDELREEMLGYRTATVQNISDLKSDLDSFEQKSKESMERTREETGKNCADLKQELNNIKKSNDIQTIRQIRNHILDFANSCRAGVRHSHEDFRSVFDENTEYESIVSKYNDIKNDYYTESLKFIKRHYQQCLDNNDFSL